MPLNAQPSATGMPAPWTQGLRLGGLKLLRLLRGVVQVAADAVTKKMFLAAYEASDDAYWRRHAGQCEWRSLGGIIEYTPDLLAVLDNRAVPVYLIAIRASANSALERVVIKLKVKKSGAIHEQTITLDDLCAIPVRKALTEIPLKAKSSKGTGWHKLGDIYIKLVAAVDRDGEDLINGQKIAQISPSTGMDSLSPHQVERWGQYWNTDSIDAEKENIKARYYRQLVQSAKKLGRPLMIRRWTYRILSSPFGLSLVFWSENLWSAKGIRHSIMQTEANNQPMRGAGGGAASTSLPPSKAIS